MSRHTVMAFLLAGTLLSSVAAAQTETTRVEEAARARDHKAASPVGPGSSRLERVLDFVERNPLLHQLSGSREGFSVRFGGIEDGSGVAAGPLWRTERPFAGRVHLHASAAVSILRDHEIDLAAEVPELAGPNASLKRHASRRYLAQERFFGGGPSSSREHEATFALERRTAGVEATLSPARWLQTSLGAANVQFEASDGAAPGVAGVSTRWQGATVPGIGTPATFAVLSFSAAADWRDVPGNPRGGGRYHVGLSRYVDRSAARYSFNRLDVTLEQHLSWWRKQRLLTLRGIAIVSSPDAGNDVPFYLQPTLGGSALLRGFVTDRFRDRNLVAAQAEYGWDLWPFLSAVLFYEAGTVARQWQDLAASELKSDYGIGFRFGSARVIALETNAAFGSGEGTRLSMRFSHAF